ncbi:sigma-70 family RNA polymerase sigma factor [Cohnella sp. 56]|uniref:sigma-70 family RNA polymerase sigma factor n=1 Tax=Cohnella sp. 56 TaxID=3113722 RepID=UPI0030E916D4
MHAPKLEAGLAAVREDVAPDGDGPQNADSAGSADRAADRDWLEHYMTMYGDAVLRTAYFYLRDRHKAEDAYQETFLRVYRALDRVREAPHPKPWILKVAIRVCLDMRKSSWWRRVLLMDRPWKETERTPPADRTYSVEGGVLRAEENRELYERIVRLNEPYRTVVLLYYYHELTTQEIGDMLQAAEGTVRSRLHRARQLLRHALDQAGEGSEDR